MKTKLRNTGNSDAEILPAAVYSHRRPYLYSAITVALHGTRQTAYALSM